MPVTAATFGANGITKVGLFVKHDSGGAAAPIRFDSFNVDSVELRPNRDTTPPRTNHTLDPATADGAAGWYKSSVKVTLAATDNDGGSGVDYTEYRTQGAATWTRYSGAVTVNTAGKTTVEYRSVDKAGQHRGHALGELPDRHDGSDDVRQAQRRGAEGDLRQRSRSSVDLDATDGRVPGVAKTEVRVDGGEWKPYVEEETILNSAADLTKWAQAGAGGLNWVDDASGGYARTFSGFGMPWYPVKEYGDFVVKLQWRDSSTGTSGNGGVFVRFPNPAEAITRTAANRYPCQVGSGQSDPAWVAIYCGHEIQINDNQPSEPQKTGSVYNFSALDATRAKVQPRGTWVDYEIRVVGQTYTISRNGEVLQTFQNTPGKTSSRSGDPSTTDRQFSKGYIGLQNHGSSDIIDYRNIRVLPLDSGSVRGPFTVEGNGAHKVEFRSTDVAGNVETTKSVDFTIGSQPAGEKTPPVTTHALNPAAPGAGGTYTGAVGVTLSATDPAEQGTGGGGAAQTLQVNATPSAWDPSSLSAKVNDTVRFNFPAATAGAPHDLWVIKPGEGKLSDGTLLVKGDLPIVLPGGASIDAPVDQAGEYTFLCKIHGHKGTTDWEGMVAKVNVTSGSTTVPGSGVDYTEYRVNTGGTTGEWVRKANTGSASPFVTSLSVNAVGSHTVEYRSVDKAGNTEATKSVSFSIKQDTGDTVTEETDLSASVPRTLGINIGGSVSFGALVPGVAKVYEAGTTVTVTSTLAASKLTIHDPGSTAVGPSGQRHVRVAAGAAGRRRHGVRAALRHPDDAGQLDHPAGRRGGAAEVPAGRRGGRPDARRQLQQARDADPGGHDAVGGSASQPRASRQRRGAQAAAREPGARLRRARAPPSADGAGGDGDAHEREVAGVPGGLAAAEALGRVGEELRRHPRASSSTDSTVASASARPLSVIVPALWRTALSTRLPSARSSSSGSACTCSPAGTSSTTTRPCGRARSAATPSAAAASSARGAGSVWVRSSSACASSFRRRALPASRSTAAWYSSVVRGLRSVRSISAVSVASGVRSSWLASWTNCCWRSADRSSASSIVLSVVPRRVISSAGPAGTSRRTPVAPWVTSSARAR